MSLSLSPNYSTRRRIAALLTLVPIAGLAYPSAALATDRVERGAVVVSSLQPEDFPPPPGAPISPLRLAGASREWSSPSDTRRRSREPSRQTCEPQFNASITTGGERHGRLSLIQMSAEELQDPPGVRYRWHLAKGVTLCKYRVYLGRGPSRTIVEPTYRDSRNGYYDSRQDDRPKFDLMFVWARHTKKKARRAR